ncbi:MAG: HYR domain-containing protein [Actinomycetota bacterium]
MFFNTPQTVSFVVADPHSGQSSWGAAWDRDPSAASSASTGSILTLEGTHYLHVHTWDKIRNNQDRVFGPFLQDTTDPSLTVPKDLVVAQSTPTGAVVTFSPAASDAMSPVTVVAEPSSGTTFPLGTTSVNVTATDSAGNRATGMFRVTVVTPSSTPGKVVAAGTISVDRKRAKLALTVQNRPRRPLKGSFTFTDPVTQRKLKSTSISALLLNGNKARVFGEAKILNRTGSSLRFVLDVEDLGKRAGVDRFRLELSDGSTYGPVALRSGSVRITP